MLQSSKTWQCRNDFYTSEHETIHCSFQKTRMRLVSNQAVHGRVPTCCLSLCKKFGHCLTHKIIALILISKEEFLHCKILLREFDCELNVVQHLSEAHLRYLIFERKGLNGHVNYPFTYTIPNSVPALSDHQKIMSWTTLSQSIKDMASELWLNIMFFDFIDG